MTTKIKRKIISVEPISLKAKQRFNDYMDSLHSCYVEEEDTNQFFLCSINKKYRFVIDKKKDENWKLVK